MKMTLEELKAKLDAHKLWPETLGSDKPEDERLDFHKADLSGISLIGANLRGANLRGAILRHANLYHADLSHANLSDADLYHADLSHANLSHANLSDANLYHADLSHANLSDANLTGAFLNFTNLLCTNLSDANLHGADLNYSVWALDYGSLRVNIDKQLAAQLMYHAMRAMQSCKDDASVAAVLASPECVALANRFHRVNECGPLKVLGNGGEAGEVGK